MSAVAAVVADVDPLLDFSPASIQRVQETIARTDCGGVRVYQLGAYVGETLRRNAPPAAWARTPRRPRSVGIALPDDAFLIDPFDIVERYAHRRRHNAEDTLVRAVADLLTWMRAPTPQTEAELGWSTTVLSPTLSRELQSGWRRRTRQWRRRRALSSLRSSLK